MRIQTNTYEYGFTMHALYIQVQVDLCTSIVYLNTLKYINMYVHMTVCKYNTIQYVYVYLNRLCVFLKSTLVFVVLYAIICFIWLFFIKSMQICRNIHTYVHICMFIFMIECTFLSLWFYNANMNALNGIMQFTLDLFSFINFTQFIKDLLLYVF